VNLARTNSLAGSTVRYL